MCAKTYVLKRPDPDDLGPPRFISERAMVRKATAELRGICHAFLIDGTVSTEEARALQSWVGEHPEVSSDVLARSIVQRLQRIFEDGVVTKTELSELKRLLASYTGETGQPIRLPFNNPLPSIVFERQSFCFTGKFASGSRTWCKGQIAKRGGIPAPRVAQSLDYLVVGSIASPAWANANYGTKIESAIELRDVRKVGIAIVPEDHWLSAL